MDAPKLKSDKYAAQTSREDVNLHAQMLVALYVDRSGSVTEVDCVYLARVLAKRFRFVASLTWAPEPFAVNATLLRGFDRGDVASTEVNACI